MSLAVTSVYGLGAWRNFGSEPRRRFGVPPGGPWDRESAQLALGLAGLGPESSVFELMHGTAEFEAQETGTLAIVGIGSISVEGMNHPACVRLPVSKGDFAVVQAQVAYIAFSERTFRKAKLDRLSTSTGTLRYLPSHEPKVQEGLKVSSTLSRAGVRLIGLPPSLVLELPSEPSCVGAIQQTPGGELIVIGPDGPTIGGYPKIGVVIDADLDQIPRLRIHQELFLEPVSWDQSRALFQQNRSNVQSLLRNLQLLA